MILERFECWDSPISFIIAFLQNNLVGLAWEFLGFLFYGMENLRVIFFIIITFSRIHDIYRIISILYIADNDHKSSHIKPYIAHLSFIFISLDKQSHV